MIIIWLSSSIFISAAVNPPLRGPLSDTDSYNPDISNILPDVGDSQLILPEISLIRNRLFNNDTFINEVLSFLKKTQDTGEDRLPSMDTAYYLGMSLKTLESLELVPTVYKDNLESLYSQIFEFIETTFNSNGGYSNWFGARSSMESTFQAINLYTLFNQTSELSISKIQLILNFINRLKTGLGGYYPLLDWDVPDITSTYRAILLKKLLSVSSLNLTDVSDSDVSGYLEGNFVPQTFIFSGSGYSEVNGGKPELLASLKAIQTYSLLNLTSPFAINVAQYLKSLTSLNGGISSMIGNNPTTGFTTRGIQLYYELKKYNTLSLDTILPVSFIDNSINYLKATKKSLSGYTSSERDSTPELISTYFVILINKYLKDIGVDSYKFDLDGVYDFILYSEQPSFGFADSPGDNGDLSYTSMVIILSRLLNNTSWINTDVSRFIEDSFNTRESGFGYKPGASPKIKYTYYGIRALRAQSNPLSQTSEITNFITKSRTLDGGFAQFPNGQLAYLSHTYWALSSLSLMGKLDSNSIDVNDILFWLSFLRNDNGTYGNSRLSDPSIISTYRALQVKTLLGMNDQQDPALSQNLSSYRLESGGYRNKLKKTVPTMEATYYGVQLALKLNLDVNLTKTVEFILALQNDDGGFALRPGFSSRLTSTYFAMLSLKIIDQVISGNGIPNEDIGGLDVFSPIIIPSFIPRVDTNKTVDTYFKTSAKIKDPETNMSKVWVETVWYPQSNQTPIITKYQGITLANAEDIYIFIIGPYREFGYLQFQIFANDELNNTASTQLFSVITSEIDVSYSLANNDSLSKLIPILPYFVLTLVLIENIFQIRRKGRLNSNENVKMSFQE